jgi:hypothetical protein
MSVVYTGEDKIDIREGETPEQAVRRARVETVVSDVKTRQSFPSTTAAARVGTGFNLEFQKVPTETKYQEVRASPMLERSAEKAVEGEKRVETFKEAVDYWAVKTKLTDYEQQVLGGRPAPLYKKAQVGTKYLVGGVVGKFADVSKYGGRLSLAGMSLGDKKGREWLAGQETRQQFKTTLKTAFDPRTLRGQIGIAGVALSTYGLGKMRAARRQELKFTKESVVTKRTTTQDRVIDRSEAVLAAKYGKKDLVFKGKGEQIYIKGKSGVYKVSGKTTVQKLGAVTRKQVKVTAVKRAEQLAAQGKIKYVRGATKEQFAKYGQIKMTGDKVKTPSGVFAKTPDGKYVILTRKGLSKGALERTTAHELQHYLDIKRGKVSFSQVRKAELRAYARELSTKYKTGQYKYTKEPSVKLKTETFKGVAVQKGSKSFDVVKVTRTGKKLRVERIVTKELQREPVQVYSGLTKTTVLKKGQTISQGKFKTIGASKTYEIVGKTQMTESGKVLGIDQVLATKSGSLSSKLINKYYGVSRPKTTAVTVPKARPKVTDFKVYANQPVTKGSVKVLAGSPFLKKRTETVMAGQQGVFTKSLPSTETALMTSTKQAAATYVAGLQAKESFAAGTTGTGAVLSTQFKDSPAVVTQAAPSFKTTVKLRTLPRFDTTPRERLRPRESIKPIIKESVSVKPSVVPRESTKPKISTEPVVRQQAVPSVTPVPIVSPVVTPVVSPIVTPTPIVQQTPVLEQTPALRQQPALTTTPAVAPALSPSGAFTPPAAFLVPPPLLPKLSGFKTRGLKGRGAIQLKKYRPSIIGIVRKVKRKKKKKKLTGFETRGI